MKPLAFFTLFLALTFLALMPSAFAGTLPPLSGPWTGSLDVSGTTLHLVCHFTSKPDGALSGTFDSLDQGATGLPFSTVTTTGQAVHLEASTLGISFDGTLDASAKTIKGFWKQSGNILPLTLTKTDHVAGLDRPQEPHPPFPYTSTDVTFPGGAVGVTLAGTLTTPPGAGPFPVAVLISGSGPNDRDETILGHKPFLLLADTLTRRGVAVLRYDKRGIGQSSGSYALATTADLAADANFAVNFLKTRVVIDPKRIGLLGHSEGGIIAPLVASEHPADIAFVVLLAGQGMDGEKILLAQAALIGQANGNTNSEIAHNASLQKHLFTLSLSKANPITVQSEAQAAVLQSVATMDAAQRAEIADPARFAEAQSQAVASPWMRFFLPYDPKPALQKTRCPVLALDGSKDLQVPPAEDLAAIGSALKSGGNTDVTVKEFPNLNHLFQTCTTGSPSEYAKIPETMAPVALTTISDWIVAHTR